MASPSFAKLNDGWNAEPNAPHPRISIAGSDLLLHFFVDPHQYKQFAEDDRGAIRFFACSRFRLGPTNDEGWYRGQCRYGKAAPKWGEFYEVSRADIQFSDWQTATATASASRHFLFYFRDETFECIAADWQFDAEPTNALFRHFGAKIA